MDQEMLQRLWGAEADEEYWDEAKGSIVARYEITPRRRGFSRLRIPKEIGEIKVWENPQSGQLEHQLC